MPLTVNILYDWINVLKIFVRLQVAILDIDVCGPSIPRLMGVIGEEVGFIMIICSVLNVTCLTSSSKGHGLLG